MDFPGPNDPRGIQGGWRGKEAPQAVDGSTAEEPRSRDDRCAETERTLQALLQAAPLAIGTVDLDGTVRIWNPAAERMFGWRAQDVAGRRLGDLFGGAAGCFEPLLVRAREGRVVEFLEIAGTRRDGTPLVAAFSTAPLRRADGSVEGMLWIAADETDRHRAEEALRQSNAAFEALINASPLAIVTFDADGIITMWNPAAERMFGWTASEAVGRFHPIVPDEAREEFRAFREIALRGGTLAGVEVRRRRKDGSPIDIRFFTAPLRGPDGTVTSIMSIIVDVTEQKATEEALRRTEERFLQAQKMEAVGRLAGGVAHDFNNLLMAITGHCELLQAQLAEDDPLRGELEEIRRAGERAASLTRQLLAFSRRQVVDFRVVDLNEIVAATEKMLRRLIGEDVEIVTSLGEGVGRIKADPGQVEQVIMNLAVNARDAMPRGGTLSIATAEVVLEPAEAERIPGAAPGRYARLAVADTGCGMDETVRSHLFEPFFTTKEHGTGLGLATVYGIVQQLGGFVRVETAPGRGTTFEIFFPWAGAQGARSEAAEEPLRPAAGAETVLVAEDEDLVRDLVCEILRRSGYAVLEARDGHEALAVAERHRGPIHLLLTDVVMPRMSGSDLARRLASRRPEMRVLYMSGYTDDETLRRGVLAGGKAFLQKPFRAAVLAARVREVLDAPHGS